MCFLMLSEKSKDTYFQKKSLTNMEFRFWMLIKILLIFIAVWSTQQHFNVCPKVILLTEAWHREMPNFRFSEKLAAFDEFWNVAKHMIL